MTFDLFMVSSNLCPSCDATTTGRMLHGICKYAIAVVVFFFFFFFFFLFLSGERIVVHGPLGIYCIYSYTVKDSVGFTVKDLATSCQGIHC